MGFEIFLALKRKKEKKGQTDKHWYPNTNFKASKVLPRPTSAGCAAPATAGDTYSDDVSVVQTICNIETSPNKGLDQKTESISISFFTILSEPHTVTKSGSLIEDSTKTCPCIVENFLKFAPF